MKEAIFTFKSTARQTDVLLYDYKDDSRAAQITE
jgi:hypothetical protein